VNDKASVASLRLYCDAFGHLVLVTPDGQTTSDVVPVRAFPFSAPDQWISLCDQSGREILCLTDLDGLAPETRTLLQAELAQREFIPHILRILRVVEGGGSDQWFVTTDRGDRSFELPGEDNIRRMGDDGALIIDAHGIRYRIASVRKLDAPSRRILRQYL
jgi:hypothetical protein